MNIVVPESVSDEELTALLNQLLQETRQRTGFQYHEHPTVVGIFAYASREHAASGRWEAMATSLPDRSVYTWNAAGVAFETSVSFRYGRGTAQEPEIRFGLTRQERMDAYKEEVRAEIRGHREAERESLAAFGKPPYRLEPLGDEWKTISELRDRLIEQYKLELADELSITRDQLQELQEEGFDQNWVAPAYKW